ncbi:MAG: gliding motility lipoprotein GldH [Flavobacteriales bacterium]|nr:gliding motility lipoprotein GldH [Flavobacteriales bacterium]
MRTLTSFFCCAGMAAVLLSSCGPGPVSADAAPLDAEGWMAADTVRLTFEVENPEHRHDLQLGLRHNDQYPFSNLYLFVQLTYPNGKTLTDTLACPLAGPDGRWYGKGSDWIDHRIGYKKGVGFPLAGIYTLDVVHAMRQDPLVGISDLRFAMFDRTAE